MLNPAGWALTDTADNDVASVEVAATSGKKHVIYAISVSFSAVNVGKLAKIKVGNEVVWQAFVHDSGVFEFQRGIAAPVGVAVTAELAASGEAGTVGAVSLHGVTI